MGMGWGAGMSEKKVHEAIEENLLPALGREADALATQVKRARANDEHIVLSDAHVSELVALLKHAARRIEAQAADVAR